MQQKNLIHIVQPPPLLGLYTFQKLLIFTLRIFSITRKMWIVCHYIVEPFTSYIKLASNTQWLTVINFNLLVQGRKLIPTGRNTRTHQYPDLVRAQDNMDYRRRLFLLLFRRVSLDFNHRYLIVFSVQSTDIGILYWSFLKSKYKEKNETKIFLYRT